MALLDIFSYKNSKERQREYLEYLQEVFPFGDAQKEKITILLKNLLPKEFAEIALFNYLTIKYETSKYFDKSKNQITDEGLMKCCKLLKNTIGKNSKNSKAIYIALAEADLNIDNNLNYPDIDILLSRANKIKEIVG